MSHNQTVEGRLTELLFTIVEADPDGEAVAMRMVGATLMLSKGLNATKRFRISEKMRDAADVLERHAMRIEIS